MTGRELADLCAAQVGQAYVWGGLGYTLTESRLAQLKAIYPKTYTASYEKKAREFMGKPVYDCVGLIKHFLWGNKGDGVLKYYGTNNIPDTTANGLYALSTARGVIATLPEMPGLLLHRDGHVGIYIGGGKLVEARGIYYGVVLSNVRDRDFTAWGKLPGVEYKAEQPEGKTITFDELKALLKEQSIETITL